MIRPLRLAAVAAFFMAASAWALSARGQEAGDALDFPIPGGHFYKQANGQGGSGFGGFAVVDGGIDVNGNSIRMWSEFQRLGGVSWLGYPISRRFKYYPQEGFVYQAFQKAVLQWEPITGNARLTNLMDELHDAGFDPTLQLWGYPPWEPDTSGGDYQKARFERLGWLEDPAYSDFKEFYFQGGADAETLFGLPAGRPRTYGWVRALRLQRTVFSSYNGGPVVLTNAGDDAKRLAFLHGDPLKPQLADEPDLTAWLSLWTPPTPTPTAVWPMGTISGSGEGWAVVDSPDYAVVPLHVYVARVVPISDEALERELDELLRKVKGALASEGVAEGDLEIGRTYFSGRGPPAPVMRRADKDLRVTVSDVDKLADIMAGATAAGARKVGDIRLEATNELPYKQKAYDNALWLARQEVMRKVAQSGCQLGDEWPTSPPFSPQKTGERTLVKSRDKAGVLHEFEAVRAVFVQRVSLTYWVTCPPGQYVRQ